MKNIRNVILALIMPVFTIILIPDRWFWLDCPVEETITFRNIKVKFPLDAFDVKKSLKNITYGPSEQVNAELLRPGITVQFIFGSNWNIYQQFRDEDLKWSDIEAVTFSLHNEIQKSDTEIIKELTQQFPGHYECRETEKYSFYVFQGKCTSIIYKRDLYNILGPVPEITFSYHLDATTAAERAFRASSI